MSGVNERTVKTSNLRGPIEDIAGLSDYLVGLYLPLAGGRVEGELFIGSGATFYVYDPTADNDASITVDDGELFVNGLPVGGGGGGGTWGSITGTLSSQTDLQSALDAKAASSHTHTASQITDFSEAVDDEVATLLQAGTDVTVTYNDAANTLTVGLGGNIPRLNAASNAFTGNVEASRGSNNGLSGFALSGGAGVVLSQSSGHTALMSVTGGNGVFIGPSGVTAFTYWVNVQSNGRTLFGPITDDGSSRVQVSGNLAVSGVTTCGTYIVATLPTPAARQIAYASDIQSIVFSTATQWRYSPSLPVGTNGYFVPTGGTTGQALVKSSNSNGAVEWQTVSGGGGGGGISSGEAAYLALALGGI